jgi:RNA polymerase sigma factor for flagellar operon FliA
MASASPARSAGSRPVPSGSSDAAALSEDELVGRHLPLVQYAVSEMAARIPRHVNRDDLVSAAMIGLVQAARAYDPARGISFSRFANVRIRGAILDELRSRDWASRSVRAKARLIAASTERLTARLGRTPTQAELADASGMDDREVRAVTDDVHRAVVLNLEGLTADGNAEEILLVGEDAPDTILLERERCAYLVAAVANLPVRLRRVVIGYFLEELPMQTLAIELGVTDSRISQMRAEALTLLRDVIDAQLDPDRIVPVVETARVATRRASYRRAVATHADFRTRLDPRSASLASLAAIA